MVALTLLIHLAGLGALIALMRFHGLKLMTRRAMLNNLVIILGAGFGLFALHTLEIWIYAGLYDLLGAFHEFESALYFSTVTYSTLGYGDLTLPKAWRILGAIEGANGIILLGWSTAFFISIVQRLRTLEHNWLNPPDP